MNKFLKWILVVNVLILILIAVRFVFFVKNTWTPPSTVDNSIIIMAQRDSIKIYQSNIDSLNNLLKERELIIKQKTLSLIKLKKDYESRKQSVLILPADQSAEFFTEFINEEIYRSGHK